MIWFSLNKVRITAFHQLVFQRLTVQKCCASQTVYPLDLGPPRCLPLPKRIAEQKVLAWVWALTWIPRPVRKSVDPDPHPLLFSLSTLPYSLGPVRKLDLWRLQRKGAEMSPGPVLASKAGFLMCILEGNSLQKNRPCVETASRLPLTPSTAQTPQPQKAHYVIML